MEIMVELLTTLGFPVWALVILYALHRLLPPLTSIATKLDTHIGNTESRFTNMDNLAGEFSKMLMENSRSVEQTNILLKESQEQTNQIFKELRQEFDNLTKRMDSALHSLSEEKEEMGAIRKDLIAEQKRRNVVISSYFGTRQCRSSDNEALASDRNSES